MKENVAVPKSEAAENKAPIIVVGAGPVGLFQALSLYLKGIECVILEKRSEAISDTRSLGIHPPCLVMLEELGLFMQLTFLNTQVLQSKLFLILITLIHWESFRLFYSLHECVVDSIRST